jgi:hypothetical protein
LLYLQIYVTGGRIDICIISDRHADIKNKVEEIWCQPLEYHQYWARHFVSNFNHKFKDPDANFFLIKMCYESSKCKFYLWYQRMCNINPTYKE